MDKTIKFAFNLRRCHRSVCLCVNEISSRLNKGRPISDQKKEKYEDCFETQRKERLRCELERDDCIEKLFKR